MRRGQHRVELAVEPVSLPHALIGVIVATVRQVTPRGEISGRRPFGSRRPARYLVVKLPVADDRLPMASRLNTWKKYCALRVRPVIVTEWLVTRFRSRLVALS